MSRLQGKKRVTHMQQQNSFVCGAKAGYQTTEKESVSCKRCLAFLGLYKPKQRKTRVDVWLNR